MLEVARGRQLVLDPTLLDAVARRRDEVLTALAGGADVYGVTTGMGALSGTRLAAAEQDIHQRQLLLGRAVGGPPWLDEVEVRALYAVRLRSFLHGDAGVSAELCQALVDALSGDSVPAVPRTGVGSAGEIIPLAHAFSPLIGLGQELRDGAVVAAAGSGYSLGAKEGIALLAGLPGVTGLSTLLAADSRLFAQQQLAVAAGSIVVAAAARGPYGAATARADPALAAVLQQLRDLIGPEPAPRALQAPLSFRVVGPVLAHLQRAIGQLEDAVDRTLGGVGDSPAYLDEAFVSTAGFHGADLAGQLAALSLAVAHAAEVSAARLHRLLDERVTGLSAQLASRPGPDAGLVVVHKRAVAAVHALRRAAQPSLLGVIETSGGQEDVQSFSWEAAEQLRTVLQLAREVIACEALAVRQGLHLSRGTVPAGLTGWSAELSALVPEIKGDRAFGLDLEVLLAALGRGELVAQPQ